MDQLWNDDYQEKTEETLREETVPLPLRPL
jgi:hypothetical protein